MVRDSLLRTRDKTRPAASANNVIDICHLVASESLHSPRFLYKEGVSACRAGWSVAIVGPSRVRVPTVIEGVRAYPVRASSSKLRLRATVQIALAARRIRPRAVHAHDLPTLLVGDLLRRRYGCRLIYDANEDRPLVHPRNLGLPHSLAILLRLLLSAYERFLTRRAEAVLTVDEVIASRFRGWGRTTTVVRNMSWRLNRKSEPRPPELDRYAGRPIFIYLGQISQQVAGLQTLEAMRIVSQHRPDAVLVVLGGYRDDAYAATFKAAAQRAGISESVVVLPSVPYPDVAGYLVASTVGLITYGPRDNYGDRARWPHKLCDYLAAGLPMIATDFAGLRGVLGPLGVARFVNPVDSGSIAEAMLAYLNDPHQTRAMAERCTMAHRSGLSWDNEQARLLAVYRGALGPPGDAGRPEMSPSTAVGRL